ncbi:aminoglycoside phosphotransferase family protein [Streptomyces sp. NPDC003327]
MRVPEQLAQSQAEFNGEAGRAFVAALPGRAAEFLERWGLRATGKPMCGVAALVLPVERGDGTPAALKLQLVDEETEGEPVALRAWAGEGAVRLLSYDAGTGTMLLERLDETRPLSALPDAREAVRILGEVLARLSAVPAPPGLRRLGDVAARMLDRAPGAAERLGVRDGGGGLGGGVQEGGGVRVGALLLDCAAAVREVVAEPGDRLLHWDLHEGNVLGAVREPWLAIDPKPLAGDPGFELLPALVSRECADPAELLWRFDLLTERLGLDRGRAGAWTLGRVLQNGLWNVEGGGPALPPEQQAVARVLLARRT